MINFKDTKDQTPSALAVLGIVLLAVSAIVSVFFRESVDTQKFSSKLRKDKVALDQRKMAAQSDKSVYEYAIEQYQWPDKEDVVTPQALTIISKRVEENGLKLVSFRPTKSSDAGSMIQLPLQFTVDGSFASVTAMIDALQANKSRLAVQAIQLASQEGQTDLVSANISLIAFLNKPAKKAASTTTKTIITTSAPKNPPAQTGSKTN